jgi:hypothetical protein
MGITYYVYANLTASSPKLELAFQCLNYSLSRQVCASGSLTSALSRMRRMQAGGRFAYVLVPSLPPSHSVHGEASGPGRAGLISRSTHEQFKHMSCA